MPYITAGLIHVDGQDKAVWRIVERSGRSSYTSYLELENKPGFVPVGSLDYSKWEDKSSLLTLPVFKVAPNKKVTIVSKKEARAPSSWYVPEAEFGKSDSDCEWDE